MPDDDDVRVGEDLSEVRTPGEVRLRGVRCQACGTPAFPAQANGCEHCGGDLRSLKLVPDRTQSAFTAVPAEDGADAVLCEVVLAAGPSVRAWWAGSTPPWVGAAVTGATAVEPTTGSGFFADLRQRRACIAARREQPDPREDQPLMGLRPSFGLVPAARPDCLSAVRARRRRESEFR